MPPGSTQAAGAGLALDALLGDRNECIVGEAQFHLLHLEQLLVLLEQRVLRLLQDLDQRLDVEVFQRRDHRQTADEFGDQAELEQIFRLGLTQIFAVRFSSGAAT